MFFFIIEDFIIVKVPFLFLMNLWLNSRISYYFFLIIERLYSWIFFTSFIIILQIYYCKHSYFFLMILRLNFCKISIFSDNLMTSFTYSFKFFLIIWQLHTRKISTFLLQFNNFVPVIFCFYIVFLIIILIYIWEI